MSASDFTRNHLDQAEGEVSAAAGVAAARVERLLRQIFLNGEYAVRKYKKLLPERGPGALIYIITDRGSKGDRVYHFGFLNHGFIDRRNRQKVLEGLNEIPEAIRAHAQLVQQHQDLLTAKRAHEQRADARRLEDPERKAVSLPTGRTRH